MYDRLLAEIEDRLESGSLSADKLEAVASAASVAGRYSGIVTETASTGSVTIRVARDEEPALPLLPAITSGTDSPSDGLPDGE